MYRKKESNLPIIVGGLFIAFLIVLFAVACNNVEDDSPTVYYPHTSQYGYYDSKHHWHYHPQYKPKPAYKAPAPKPGPRVAAPKAGGGTKSFSSPSRRR